MKIFYVCAFFFSSLVMARVRATDNFSVEMTHQFDHLPLLLHRDACSFWDETRAKIEENPQNIFELCIKENMLGSDSSFDAKLNVQQFLPCASKEVSYEDSRRTFLQRFETTLNQLIKDHQNIFAYFFMGLAYINQGISDQGNLKENRTKGLRFITIAADGYLKPALLFLKCYYANNSKKSKHIEDKILKIQDLKATYDEEGSKLQNESLIYMVAKIIDGDYFDTFVMEESMIAEESMKVERMKFEPMKIEHVKVKHISYKALYYDKFVRSICAKLTTKSSDLKAREIFYKGLVAEFTKTTRGYIQSIAYTWLDPISSKLVLGVPITVAVLSYYYNLPVGMIASIFGGVGALNTFCKIPVFATMESELLENEIVLTALCLTLRTEVYSNHEAVASQASHLWFYMPSYFGMVKHKALSYVVWENNVSLNLPPQKINQSLFNKCFSNNYNYFLNWCFKKNKIKIDEFDIESGL